MAEVSIADWCSRQQLLLSEQTAKAARNVFLHLISQDVSPVNVKQDSPHRGRYIANWKIGQYVGPLVQTEDRDPTRTATAEKIKSFITDDYFLQNKSVVMYNTSEYHVNVEEDGWAVTGPYAPVMHTMRWAEQTNLFF